jgi:hypothetical protein
MPMTVSHESTRQKILLSPLRITGSTISMLGSLTMGVGKAIDWLGNKIAVRAADVDRYVHTTDYRKIVQKIEKENELGTQGEDEEEQGSSTKKKRSKKAELLRLQERIDLLFGRGGYNAGHGDRADTGVEASQTATFAPLKLFDEQGQNRFIHLDEDDESTDTGMAMSDDSLLEEKTG